MTATILDGTATAARIREEIARDAAEFAHAHGRAPGLATMLVGSDEASKVYVGNKIAACNSCGIASFHADLPGDVEESEVLGRIAAWAADDAVDGILVQLPLPAQVGVEAVLNAIPADKDVDGFNPVNYGNIVTGYDALPQCTPAGVIALLDAYEVEIDRANICVVGASDIVGKPLAMMLISRGATVTVCHDRTRDLRARTREAEILISATGVPGLITADMVRPGAAVVDVGIHRGPDGIVGDVRFEEVAEVAAFVSPVPGGAGPMTVAMLMRNTVDAAVRRAAADAVRVARSAPSA